MQSPEELAVLRDDESRSGSLTKLGNTANQFESKKVAGLRRIGIAATIASGIAARMYDCRYSFNGDEIFCVRATSRSFSYMIQAVISDRAHPPLYYLLLYAWVHVAGSSEVAVRLLSVLASALFLIVIAVIAGKLLKGFAAWFLLGICAIDGFLVYYGQEARPWAVSALCCSLSIWCLLRLEEHPERKSNKILYAASCATVIYSHYLGLFFLIAQFIGAYLARLRSRRQIISYGALGTATIIPWICVMGRELMPSSLAPNIGWVPRPTSWEIPHLYMSVMEAYSIHGTRYVIVVLTLLILSSLLVYRNHVSWSSTILFAFLAALPLAAAMVISRHAAVSIWAPRELVGPIIAIFCLLALALAAHQRSVALILGSALIACSVAMLPAFLPHNTTPDWRFYAAAAKEMCPNCSIYTSTISEQISLGYYSGQPVYAINTHLPGGELRSLNYWLPNPPPPQSIPDHFVVMCTSSDCGVAADLLHQGEVTAERSYKLPVSTYGTGTLSVFMVSNEKQSSL